MYDYLVIGAGSGGIASARRAASYGAKVAIIEAQRLGGTCVNVGCVPKKVMFNAAALAENIAHSKSYGFNVTTNSFEWSVLKKKRDDYVKRLNGIYENNLAKDNIEIIHGFASFIDNSSVKVGDRVLRAKHILIAVGSKAWIPELPGSEHGGFY